MALGRLAANGPKYAAQTLHANRQQIAGGSPCAQAEARHAYAMDRTHLRFRVEYLKGSAVVDYFDTEDSDLPQALIGAEWHLDQSKREHGTESFRVLDRQSGLYFRSIADIGTRG